MQTDNQQPKLLIRYKEDQARTGLFIAIALSPIWALWSLYVASWLLKAVILGGIVGYEDLLALFCFYMGLVACGAFTIMVCLDNRFVISPAGLELPWRFLVDMAFLRKRPWNELSILQFKNDELVLRFGHALAVGQARFRLDGLKTSDLKDLVVAIRSNSPETQCVFDRRSVEMGIPGIQHNPNDESFTAIWERDLASRFGSTTFVPLEAGAKLQDGKFTVIGQVSFGGLSAIYLCKDSFGDSVVLKEAVVPVSADAATKAKAIEMFKREAKILQGLSHPNIARVLDHFVENERDYLVLEHVNGLDLRAYVKEHGPQNQKLIMRWALEIADVLSYLHKQEPCIIHRDVTPDNLVLDRTGAIKLIDFGAANEFLATATGTLVGKQAYISPEQFRGKAVPKSDIYSLGCTLYYLATATDPEALSQSSLPEPIISSMAELNSLIEQCTQMELEDRIDSMESVCSFARSFLQSVHQSV